MSYQQTKKAGVPKSRYTHDFKFAIEMQSAMGVIDEQIRFGKRFMPARNFMVLLGDVIKNMENGRLDNKYQKKKCGITLPLKTVMKINQIWKIGTPCILTRDPEKPSKIISRVLAFRVDKTVLENQKLVEKIKQYFKQVKLDHLWEFNDKKFRCRYCNSRIFAIMNITMFDQVRDNFAFVFCSNCDYKEKCTVEMKPALEQLNPVRPPTTNPIWREITGTIPVRFAYRNVNIIDLANIGKVVKKYGNISEARFRSQEEINNSIELTQFPSKHYFDTTTRMLFDEWFECKAELASKFDEIIEEDRLSVFAHEPERPKRYTETTPLE